jgi:hypothetical protein
MLRAVAPPDMRRARGGDERARSDVAPWLTFLATETNERNRNNVLDDHVNACREVTAGTPGVGVRALTLRLSGRTDLACELHRAVD